jgi:hypothetical protein
VKKIDVPSLRGRIQKTDEKWRISVQSFNNEFSFYRQATVTDMRLAGALIPFPISVNSEIIDDSEFVRHSRSFRLHLLQNNKARAADSPFFWNISHPKIIRKSQS